MYYADKRRGGGMVPKTSLVTRFFETTRQTRRRASGWMLCGCLFGIAVACIYNFLLISDKIGAMSEHSMSEEKVI
jgi:hypothetical protein